MKFSLCVFFLIINSRVFSQSINNSLKSRFTLSNGADYLHNTIVIKYKTGLPYNHKKKNNGEDSLPIKLKSATIVSIKKKFPLIPSISFIDKAESKNSKDYSGTEKKEVGNDLENIYELKYSGNQRIEDVINQILKDSDVVYAEPSYIYHPLYNPNDSLYISNSQYYLEQIKAVESWELINNSSNIIIGIIDAGCDLVHEDLAANIYLNKADPVNGIDDDQDGYVDNYSGWDFVGNAANSVKEDNNSQVNSSKSNHGVHVSGLVSAVSDNKIGIASAALNAKLMIIKAGSDDNGNNILKGYEGIKYAADHGAKIINCSWGGDEESQLGLDIINYAISKDCLIITAAGNSNNSNPVYPAAYKGVLAVANVQSTDVKNPFSSFGDYVGISAPGTNIISTVYHNQYGSMTGTSMAAALVASAAALVTSYLPRLTMQQVAQQLRVTADNIDNKNPDYKGQLGKGRLNIYQALTQTLPSIRNEKLTVADSSKLEPGDTALLYFDLKNYLFPTKNLVVSLNSLSPNVKILSEEVSVGHLGSLETQQVIGPFKIYISPTVVENMNVTFKLNYTDKSLNYTDNERLAFQINLDYLNVQVNKIQTTMTSNGRIGYSNSSATNGLGFRYKGINYLYEASLMIGNSPLSVSNNARNEFGSNEDFVKTISAKTTKNTSPDFEGYCEFNDSASSSPLNIDVKHHLLAFSTAPNDKYCIAEYSIINKNNMDLKGVYIGLFTDWNLDISARDITKYNPLYRLGYMYGKFEKSVYAGVKLLSTSSSPLYSPLSAFVKDNPLYKGFSTADKYKSLSNGVSSLSLGENSVDGYDVSFVSGYGPYIVSAHDSIKVAFAIIAAEDYDDLQSSAKAAQNKYDSLFPDNILYFHGVTLKQNYPNPFADYTTIPFSIPFTGKVTIEIFNSMGVKVKTVMNTNLSSGNYALNINIENIPSGLYLYTLNFNGIRKSRKLIILK